MTIMNKYVSGAIVAAVGLLATVFAWGEAFEQRTPDNEPVALGASPGEQDTLLLQDIPPGTWIISAKVTIEGTGAADRVRCGLESNGIAIDESSAVVGAVDGVPAVATLQNQRLLTTTEPATIALVCSHDLAGAGVFVASGASLIISRDRICTAPERPECLPGFQFVPPAPDAEEGALGVCAEPDAGAPADPCLDPDSIGEPLDTRLDAGDQGPLLDNCPRSKPYYRCTAFGYCWCSSNGRR